MIRDTNENNQDRYLTIARPCEATLTVKGSRFIARFAPVSSTGRAEEFIEEIRRQFHDATHHCFAFRIGYATSRIERFSDAGEPSGTAGRPILEALQSKHIWDAAAVVTRWFGGTKLGTGGLKRAYRGAADAVLDDVTLATKLVISAYDLRFDHALTGAVYRVINEFKAVIPSTDFGDRVRMGVTVRRSEGPAFCRRLIDAGRGAIEIKFVGEGIR